MGKRRTRPLPGDRKFHAPKAKRVLQEAPGAAGSAMPILSQSSDPDGDPARMDTQASKNSGGKADPKGIPVGEHGAGSPQEGRDKEIRGGRALESPKQGISDEMEKNHLELPQLGILEADGTGEDKLESPKPAVLDGAGENCPESPKPAILEVDGAGEQPPESVKHVILDEMGQNHLELSQLGILEGNGAAEEQLQSPQLRIPEADGAGEEQLESLKLRILDGTGEEHPEAVKPGISEADEARQEQPEPLKQRFCDEAGENRLESPKQGNSGAHGSSPEDTVTDTAPAESLEVPDAAGEEEEGALEEGCGTGIALSMDTGCPDLPSDPQSRGGDAESRNSQSVNSSMATPGLDPAATESQDHQEGPSPELPTEKPFPDAAGQQPWDTTGQIHTGSTGNSPVQPWESSARATEPADASDVICGLIRELSDLNRLAMGARRGLELLRRPKPRRGQRPVPSGSRWKEG
ncbi:break repair meiotic recombinase recruitment factor 1 [Chamaea fasciata]|uniref:break repair meiotic recombinase recruitment factor 1 n=1 Tax=Chamaea fasciata TaxID=190680 RepID=UPI00336A875C